MSEVCPESCRTQNQLVAAQGADTHFRARQVHQAVPGVQPGGPASGDRGARPRIRVLIAARRRQASHQGANDGAGGDGADGADGAGGSLLVAAHRVSAGRAGGDPEQDGHVRHRAPHTRILADV